MPPKPDEQDSEKREDPVSPSVAHSWLQLRSLMHESRRLDMLDLAVDVDRDLRDQECQNEIKHHNRHTARRCVY